MTGFREAFSLDGKVALITGAGSGLGYAMAQCMVAAGAKVVVIDPVMGDHGRFALISPLRGQLPPQGKPFLSRTDPRRRRA